MLEAVQRDLEARYAGLAKDRRAYQYAVYALEHALDQTQLNQLKQLASQTIRFRAPSDEHWLVWTALGAEAGYLYSGDEFWPALEQRHGEWRTNEFRQKLRLFFRRFQRTYGGAIPVGRWAEHFSIIAWPITNAILPRYLQTHFASHIYDLRFDLAHIAKLESKEIGQFLLDRYDGGPTRFGDFLQQTELTTQIVLALRDQELPDQVHRIDTNLLSRIVSDLETHRFAKLYLSDARRVIQSTGISISSKLQSRSGRTCEDATRRDTLPVRAKLAGRMAAPGMFQIGVRLPDVASFLKTTQSGGHTLSENRIRFLGKDERLMPASVLVSLSNKERALSIFPGANEPILNFEVNDGALAESIAALCRIEERPTWVLRKQADGGYVEIGNVRCGQDYVVLCRSEPPSPLLNDGGLVMVPTPTEAVFAYSLSVPQHLTDDQKKGLKALAIGTVVGVAIEPVGLNPIPNRISDIPCWLSTEPIAFRFSADHELDVFRVSLDGGTVQNYSARSGDVILHFPGLEPGLHTVSVFLRERSESFTFEVRAPLGWKDAVRQKSGFRLVIEPPEATLEQILAFRAEVQINGPNDRPVNWSFETYDASGHLAATCPLRVTRVGATPKLIFEVLDKGRRDYSDTLDDAYRIDLVADLDELGRQAHKFTRSIEPVRWKFSAGDKRIRLIDETDHAQPISAHLYLLQSPLDAIELDQSHLLSGRDVESPGGLFEASYGDRNVSLFVSNPKEMRGLADLGIDQTLNAIGNKTKAIINLIHGIRLWEAARPVGEFALVRKAGTINKLKAEVIKLLCGYDFASLLELGSETHLDEARSKIGGSPGFRSRMRTFSQAQNFEQAQTVFAEYAKTYGIEMDVALSEAAFSLCHDPLSLHSKNEDKFEHLLNELLRKKNLLRGACLANAVQIRNGEASI